MNFYDFNILLLILLFLISLIPIAIVFHKLSEILYPLTIFVVSISLLYHTSLISTYIWGCDIHYEYYIAHLVKKSGVWIPSLEYGYNSLLMMTILAPTYSLLCNFDLIWVFKIIFPFLFSLVPVSLYQIYNSALYEFSINNKLVSILSTFVFIFFYRSFLVIPDKQYLAELFLVLIILLSIYNNILLSVRKVLAVLFSFSLVVTHHGVAYISMIAFSLVLLGDYIIQRKLSYKTLLNIEFTFFFIIITISWFMYTSTGEMFYKLVYFGEYIKNNIYDIIYNPEKQTRSGAMYLTKPVPNLTWMLYKLIHILLQFFIMFGILTLLMCIFNHCRKIKVFKHEYLQYLLLTITFYGFTLSQMAVSYWAGIDRIFQLCLILLSPCALIGYEHISTYLKKLINRIANILVYSNQPFKSKSINLFGIFLAIFLLFNSGFIFEVTKDQYPYSFALNKSTDFAIYYNQSEVQGALWAYTHIRDCKIAVQYWTPEHLLLSEFYPHDSFTFYNSTTIHLPPNTFIYLGELSTKKNKIYGKKSFWFSSEHLELKGTDFYHNILSKSNKIYDNNGSTIYLK